MSNDHLETNNGLYFPPEVEWMRTPVRDRVIEFIRKTALELAGDRVKSAFISVEHTGEVDSETLDLTLTIDSDWDYINKLRMDIIRRVIEWTSEWPKDDREDHARRIYFCLLPVNLLSQSTH